MEPGQGLLLIDSIIDVTERVAAMVRDTHLDDEDFLTTTTCAIPLPDYDLRVGNRWTGINPEMLWHPLFWLPRSVTTRLELLLDGVDEYFTEDDESLATRIALVLYASTLYDADSGTWLDVLSLHGIDTTREEDVARIQRWLNGADDDVLDSISLSEFTDKVSEMNDVGVDIAVAAEDAGATIAAGDAADILEEVFDPSEDTSPVDQRVCLALVCDMLIRVLPERLAPRFLATRDLALNTDVSPEAVAEELSHELSYLVEECSENAAVFESIFTVNE